MLYNIYHHQAHGLKKSVICCYSWRRRQVNHRYSLSMGFQNFQTKFIPKLTNIRPNLPKYAQTYQNYSPTRLRKPCESSTMETRETSHKTTTKAYFLETLFENPYQAQQPTNTYQKFMTLPTNEHRDNSQGFPLLLQNMIPLTNTYQNNSRIKETKWAFHYKHKGGAINITKLNRNNRII